MDFTEDFPLSRAVFIDPETDLVYRIGQKVKRPQLANTLKVIARDGVKALYDGELTQTWLNDITKNGGIISKEDLLQYK